MIIYVDKISNQSANVYSSYKIIIIANIHLLLIKNYITRMTVLLVFYSKYPRYFCEYSYTLECIDQIVHSWFLFHFSPGNVACSFSLRYFFLPRMEDIEFNRIRVYAFAEMKNGERRKEGTFLVLWQENVLILRRRQICLLLLVVEMWANNFKTRRTIRESQPLMRPRGIKILLLGV